MPLIGHYFLRCFISSTQPCVRCAGFTYGGQKKIPALLVSPVCLSNIFKANYCIAVKMLIQYLVNLNPFSLVTVILSRVFISFSYLLSQGTGWHLKPI